MLAIALILDGASRRDAAKFAGVTLQIVRDWALRFNADRPDGLATRKAPGRTPLLNDEQGARLAVLAQWVWDATAVPVTRCTLSRELRAMPYRKFSARLRHCGQRVEDIPVLKKTSQPVWGKSARACPKERPSSCGGRTRTVLASRPN